MITIPCTNIGTADEPLLSAATPIPPDAIAVICDGTNYTVYEPGDTVPSVGD